MSTVLPIKVDGSQVTLVAVLDDGLVFTETWTHTPDGKTEEVPDKAAIQGYSDEFSALLAVREGKQEEKKPEEFSDNAEYFDFEGKPVSKEEAQAAYDAIVTVDVDPNEEKTEK